MRYSRCVLVVAGVDSSGGAGLSRDLRVLADCGVEAVPVVTAATAQTHCKVQGICIVPAEMIRAQIECAFEANTIDAIKIGMLGTRANVEAVAQSLPAGLSVSIVLDPVLASSSGVSLLTDEGRESLREQLLPRVTLLTPNIPETAALLGKPVSDNELQLIDYAVQLRQLGPRAVLIKGGHASAANCVDLLVSGENEIERIASERVSTQMRGTGCTLGSAIAAALAKGLPLSEACNTAKDYITRELRQFRVSAPAYQKFATPA